MSKYDNEMPSSAELIQMAEREWHNRVERQGIHEKMSWINGWLSGYLTPRNFDQNEMLDKVIETIIDEKDYYTEWRTDVLLKTLNDLRRSEQR